MFARSILSLLTLGLASFGQAADPAPAQEVRIGYQVVSNILILGKAKGFFEEEFAKEGWKVRWDLFLSGPPQIEAVAGGRLDFLHTGDFPPVSARSNGVDVKVIANAGVDPVHDALIVLKSKSYADVKALKGRKIAVPIGSSAHHFLFALLAKNGLTPADVHVVSLPPPDLAKTLEKGDVDAIAVWEPYAANIVRSGPERILADSRGVKRGITVYLVRNDFGKRNPKLVGAFLRAVKRSLDFEKANPAVAARIIATESKFPQPVISDLLARYDFGLTIHQADVEAFASVKEFLRETKVLRKDFDVGELFDPSYLAASGLK